MNSSKDKWALVGRVAPGEVRVWRLISTGDLYLADESGDGAYGYVGTPDDTEDGPLMLLRDRPVEIGDRGARIPVLVERDRRLSYAPTSPQGALCLHEQHGCRLALLGREVILRDSQLTDTEA